jgi:hypothetical protein
LTARFYDTASCDVFCDVQTAPLVRAGWTVSTTIVICTRRRTQI